MGRSVSGLSASGGTSRRGDLDREDGKDVKGEGNKDRLDTLARERREAARGEKSEDWRRGMFIVVSPFSCESTTKYHAEWP